jgi:hypothetical protein
VPTPSAVNQAWNGVGADPRRWRNVPGSAAQYAIELIPANGNTSCVASNAEATMIDSATGTFRIRSTGISRGVKRSIVATFRRRGFLDYLYFTDFETADPTWYALDSAGRQTRSGSSPSYTGPDLLTWAGTPDPVTRPNVCGNTYWRDGRGSLNWSGQVFDTFNSPNTWKSLSDNCSEIQFAPQDVINGPLHTNDDLLICGSPDFGRTSQDRIEESGPGWRGSSNCSGNNPTFNGTFAPNSPVLTLPPTDVSLKNVVDPGYLFTGQTTIQLSGSSVIVNGTTMPMPPSGVIYVQNGACGQGYTPLDPYNDPAGCADVSVSGSYAGNLTIASQKDILVTDDIKRSGDFMLGLIADNFIRVYHPVVHDSPDPTGCTNSSGGPGNIEIDAAMLSLTHSFTVDNYYCGSPLGTLTVNGTIAQKYRGPVGRGSSNSIVNGYIKNYSYDDRLRFRSPPHFIDPVQAAWRIQRYREQLPPR